MCHWHVASDGHPAWGFGSGISASPPLVAGPAAQAGTVLARLGSAAKSLLLSGAFVPALGERGWRGETRHHLAGNPAQGRPGSVLGVLSAQSPLLLSASLRDSRPAPAPAPGAQCQLGLSAYTPAPKAMGGGTEMPREPLGLGQP
ncbi:hypothetical protein KIL84_021406 [Mauremys mutica]|uniref:Uncharacterized protein n=1 Tax=Mauremys mutica TaxID=74926 RepID=A0A9D3X8R5_9SAUR|nr:hypothetical protein KIL84_021406 [Mauremys mutica]